MNSAHFHRSFSVGVLAEYTSTLKSHNFLASRRQSQLSQSDLYDGVKLQNSINLQIQEISEHSATYCEEYIILCGIIPTFGGSHVVI